MSLLDDTIARAIWDGKLPLHITLHAKNTPAMAQPQEPIYVEVARLSYLTLVTHQLLPVYTGLGLEVQPEQVWYAYEGEPLKWHYPLGLLYDLLTFPASQHTTFGDKACLPWHIDVYFNGFPTDKLLRNPTLDTAQDMYMSMIKEADFLRHGTTKRVMNLSKQDQTQLWQSRIADKYNDYWSVNKQLLESGPSLRYVPLRLYLPNQCPILQELIPANDSKCLLIGDALASVLPDLFSPPDNISAIPVLHGMPLPLDTPLAWAYDNLCFADNFLHIVVSQKTDVLLSS